MLSSDFFIILCRNIIRKENFSLSRMITFSGICQFGVNLLTFFKNPKYSYGLVECSFGNPAKNFSLKIDNFGCNPTTFWFFLWNRNLKIERSLAKLTKKDHVGLQIAWILHKLNQQMTHFYGTLILGFGPTFSLWEKLENRVNFINFVTKFVIL